SSPSSRQKARARRRRRDRRVTPKSRSSSRGRRRRRRPLCILNLKAAPTPTFHFSLSTLHSPLSTPGQGFYCPPRGRAGELHSDAAGGRQRQLSARHLVSFGRFHRQHALRVAV